MTAAERKARWRERHRPRLDWNDDRTLHDIKAWETSTFDEPARWQKMAKLAKYQPRPVAFEKYLNKLRISSICFPSEIERIAKNR